MEIKIHGLEIHYEIFDDVDDVRTGNVDAGNNARKSVLLLHGWGACIEAMAPIYQYLKSKYRVYVLDFPGESGKTPPPSEPWGVPEYGEMLKSFMEELSIVNPYVIAHSFGGRVAIYLASKYQNLFDKIVLTDAAGVKPRKTFQKTVRSLTFKGGKWALQNLVPEAQREERLKEWRDKYSSADYKALKSEVMRETFKKVISLDLTDNLEKIKCPTLLIWGENDTDTPLYMAKIMEVKIPDSGLVVMKNAGHFSYLDKSADYNVIVDTFFQPHENGCP